MQNETNIWASCCTVVGRPADKGAEMGQFGRHTPLHCVELDAISGARGLGVLGATVWCAGTTKPCSNHI